MRILDRYIGQTVVMHTALVMAVLLSLYLFSSFITEVQDVGRGSYTFVDAVRYTVMLVPRQAYELFPLVALLGCMLGLGSMAGSSELTVIRAAGVSIRRIVAAVLKVGLLMMAVAALLGEVVAPPLEKIARMERAESLAKHISANTEAGLWVREGREFINMRRLMPGGTAVGVSLYRFDEQNRLVELVEAKRAGYEQEGWYLEKVTRSRISEEGTTVTRQARMPWESGLTPAVMDIVAMPPDKLSARDLYGYITHLRENGLNSDPYELAFWIRLVAPFATAGMVLLAVPFVFGSQRSASVGQRITIGALIGIGFYLFNAIFNRVGLVYHLPPLLSALLPTLVVFTLWWLLMRRVH